MSTITPLRTPSHPSAYTAPSTAGPAPGAGNSPSLSLRRIGACLDGGRFELDDGTVAARAAACLLCPGTGDSVLVVDDPGHGGFILSVLVSAQGAAAPAVLSAPHSPQLHLAQEEVTVVGTRKVGIHSVGDLDLIAARGTLSMLAGSAHLTVARSFIQNVGDWVAHAKSCAMRVRDLFYLRSRHGVLTAEDEVKLDAERVSLG